MKHTIRYPLGILVLSAVLSLAAGTESPAPGYVDFGKLTPAAGSEFVEVNIKANLISMAARLAEKSEPQIAEMLRGLQLIRVNVVGLTDANRAEMENRVKSVRSELEAQGWDRVVTAQNAGEDVGVYLKTRGQEAVAGLAVTVLEAKGEVVLVNIVGDFKPEKLAVLGERFNIEPLKKLGPVTQKP